MKVLHHHKAAADGGEGESSSESADSNSARWVGWFALGLRRRIGGAGCEDKLENEARSPDMSEESAIGATFERVETNEKNAVAICSNDMKDHSKTSFPLTQPSPVGTMANETEKGGVGNKQSSRSVLQEQPRPRRHPVLKRQPTGDEDGFGGLVSAISDEETGSSVKRRGRKSAYGQAAETDADQSNQHDDSLSNDCATSRSDQSEGSKQETRCKPLLERKPTGDEDDWNKVVPSSPRRGRRKISSVGGDLNVESAPTDQVGGPGPPSRRSRPIVSRQQTGDAETFGVQRKPRSPRRGGLKAANQTNEDESNEDAYGLSTGDFSVGGPISSKPSSCDEQPFGVKTIARPIVRRQPTGDGATFSPAIMSPPRRGRRNVAVDASESSQSQSVDDSTNASEHGPPRRARPAVRRQPTGDLCDLNALQKDIASRAPRPKNRRPRVVDDQSNSQSASDVQDPFGAEADDPFSHSNSLLEAGVTTPVEQNMVGLHRARPTVRRQATGDMTDFPLGASPSPDPSGHRKGRRRNSDSQSSSTSSAVRITRTGLVRQVTDDGSTLQRPLVGTHILSLPVEGAAASHIDSWIAQSRPLGVDAAVNLVAPGSEATPVGTCAEENAVVVESYENIEQSIDADVTNEIEPQPKGPRRGVRRNPTGDLDAFFLQESPLKPIIDDTAKRPHRWDSNVPAQPTALKRTPIGDEGDFALLLDVESDNESGGSVKDNTPAPPTALKRTPTADEGDFALLLDVESYNESGGRRTCTSTIADTTPAAAKQGTAKDRGGTLERTRGVSRTPTGDEADFAMLMDAQLSCESNGSTTIDDITSAETTTSRAAEKGSGTVAKTRGVLRTPTGDEAEFAMLLKTKIDADDSTFADSNPSADTTSAPEGRISRVRRTIEKAKTKVKTRGVQKMPTGDEADFAMLRGIETEGGKSSSSNDDANRDADTISVVGISAAQKGSGTVGRTRGVQRIPTGDEAAFAMLLGMDSDGGFGESTAFDATNRESGTTTDAAAPNSRGVKRTPTGDGLDFAMYIDAADTDVDNDDRNNQFAKDLEEAKRNARVAATAATAKSPTRRALHRTPSGDETCFGLMMGIQDEEG